MNFLFEFILLVFMSRLLSNLLSIEEESVVEEVLRSLEGKIQRKD